MSRYNGEFRHKPVNQPTIEEYTGFYENTAPDDWSEPCICYIEKSAPPRQAIGESGQMFEYSYKVFIPKLYRKHINLTDIIELTHENGLRNEITVKGVDNQNRKARVLWG